MESVRTSRSGTCLPRPCRCGSISEGDALSSPGQAVSLAPRASSLNKPRRILLLLSLSLSSPSPSAPPHTLTRLFNLPNPTSTPAPPLHATIMSSALRNVLIIGLGIGGSKIIPELKDLPASHRLVVVTDLEFGVRPAASCFSARSS